MGDAMTNEAGLEFEGRADSIVDNRKPVFTFNRRLTDAEMEEVSRFVKKYSDCIVAQVTKVHPEHSPTDTPDQVPVEVLAVVNEQTDNDGLWFIARTAPEAYLQQELRRLHAIIENTALEQHLKGEG